VTDKLLELVGSPWALLLVVLIFGFLPRFCLRLIMLAYPRDHMRRRELIADLLGAWSVAGLGAATELDFLDVRAAPELRTTEVRDVLEAGCNGDIARSTHTELNASPEATWNARFARFPEPTISPAKSSRNPGPPTQRPEERARDRHLV